MIEDRASEERPQKDVEPMTVDAVFTFKFS